MSFAPGYTPSNSFADDEQNQAAGRSTVRTAEVDVQLAAVSASFNALNSNVQKIQRDDDKLRDFIVEPYALSEQTRAMMAAAGANVRGQWLINTQYAVGDMVQRNAVAYICQTAHNSGPAFNVGFWLAISGDGSAQVWAEQALASQNASATSAATASGAALTAVASASAALVSQNSAASSALAAQNSANSIAGLAPVNLSAYMLTVLANANAADTRADLGVSASAETVLIANHANTANPALGAGLEGFNFALNYAQNTSGWGVRTAGNFPNVLRYIPVAEWANVLNGTTTTDLTTYLQSALNTGEVHFLPRGKYPVSATTGLIWPAGGGGFVGAGKNHSMIWAILGTGATEVQMTAYTSGSVIRRAFNPAGTNAYLGSVVLRDLAIILNHPTGAVTTTEIQIGVDLRNVGRFDIERVHVGNYAPISSFVAKTNPPNGYAQQGYCFITGSVSSSDPAYAGGEVGNIISCAASGAYKGIVMDDLTLAPSSASHGINVSGCDIQGCHHLLVQESQYTQGFVWENNSVQNVVRRQGDASPTYLMRIAGKDNDVRPGYIEAGQTDYLLRLDSTSDNNRVALTHYSATNIGIAAFSDVGRRNRVECRRDTGTYPSGVDSKGVPTVRYDRSYEEMSVIAHWSGAAMVADGGFGLTVTRPTGAGDYLFTYALPVIDANAITLEVSIDTNASGHAGAWAVISKGTSNIRLQFYSQNGATTTAIDPRFVFVKVKQVVTA